MHSSFFSLALLLLSPSLAARADDSPPKPTAPELYKRALGHLNEGLWFEAAIAELTQAVQLDPTNSDYHLALGCAEVDRAGSLAYAAWMTDQLFNAQAQYPKDLAAWQAAQNDPNSDGFSDTAPVAPPDMTFQVKDDLHHLTLTGKQAVARVIELGTAAQGEWRQAVQLAPTRQTRAQAESVQGWGLLSERRILQFTDYPEAKVPTAPKPMDAVVAFRSATKDDPDKAAYWEGLGDAYPYSEFDPDTEAPQTSYALDIIRAWQKSLALATGNTGLGFKLYEVQSRHTTENPPLDPKLALETLKTVAASDPGNSLLQYGLAALLFKQTHYSDVRDRVDPTTINSDQPTTKEQADAWRNKVAQDLAAKDDAASEQIASEAIDAIEQGNAGDHYDIPEYAPPVPKILQHAWDYWDYMEQLTEGSFVFAAKLRELARAAGGYSLVAAQLGNENNAVRAANACIGMGFKMVGDWPVRDETPQDGRVIQALVGIAIAATGYNTLQRAYDLVGDTGMALQTATEYGLFKDKQKAYSSAVMKALIGTEASDQASLWNNY